MPYAVTTSGTAERSRHAASCAEGSDGHTTRRLSSRSSGRGGRAMTNWNIEPRMLDTVHQCSRTSRSRELALNRGRRTAPAPPRIVAPKPAHPPKIRSRPAARAVRRCSPGMGLEPTFQPVPFGGILVVCATLHRPLRWSRRIVIDAPRPPTAAEVTLRVSWRNFAASISSRWSHLDGASVQDLSRRPYGDAERPDDGSLRPYASRSLPRTTCPPTAARTTRSARRQPRFARRGHEIQILARVGAAPRRRAYALLYDSFYHGQRHGVGDSGLFPCCLDSSLGYGKSSKDQPNQ